VLTTVLNSDVMKQGLLSRRDQNAYDLKERNTNETLPGRHVDFLSMENSFKYGIKNFVMLTDL
jgi:hypothetical protein